MTRISENQLARSILGSIIENRERYNKYSQELSSGLKVVDPGDSKFASTIEQYRELLTRIEGHQGRISAVTAAVSFQDNAISQAADLLVRAKELASQAANESNGPNGREQLAHEVFELRDHLVNLANSKYQDKYIFGGQSDEDPPYNAVSYDSPASGAASQRYVYDLADPGSTRSRTVKVTDDVTVTQNTPGNEIFDTAIQALERLGRALQGYSTTLDGNGVPTGAGNVFNLPNELNLQTKEIQGCILSLDQARQNDLMPERVNIGARLRRLESASSLLELTKGDAEEVLSNLQNADYTTSATNLTQAQTALEASYTVTSRILNLSVLDYL